MRWLRMYCGIVFALLELVADHGHFLVEVLLLDEAIDEPIGLELDAELEIVVGAEHGFVIVGAVEPGGAVEAWPRGPTGPCPTLGNSGLPLKSMCSSRWAMPLSP